MGLAQDFVDRMRRERSDLPEVEAKAARGGFPTSLTPTLSALANLPGGGWVVLGVDESDGFRPVLLDDAATLRQAVVAKARRGYVPPVSVEVAMDTVDSVPVVLVRVAEAPASAKPCRVASTGESFMRFWDGDYRLSEQEVQGFLANRTQPDFDRQPVDGAVFEDLDVELVEALASTARRTESRLRRIVDDRVLLRKLGVLDEHGAPTVAGLLALGDYPQQWFPNFVIQAAVSPGRGDGVEVRVGDTKRFAGPIPVMLDEALDWVMGHSREQVIETSDGRVRSRLDFPPVAVRELLSNALVHRDLAPWSWSRAIELRITPDALVLTNPGGLFGITLDRLGRESLTSARNLALVRVCQYVSLRDGRVVEALATGIPRVLESLRDAGLPEPRFFDQALRFTAMLTRAGSVDGSTAPRTVERAGAVGAVRLTPRQREVLAAIAEPAGSTVAEISVALSSKPDAVRKVLAQLGDRHAVEQIGGRGTRGTRYRRVGAADSQTRRNASHRRPCRPA